MAELFNKDVLGVHGIRLNFPTTRKQCRGFKVHSCGWVAELV